MRTSVPISMMLASVRQTHAACHAPSLSFGPVRTTSRMPARPEIGTVYPGRAPRSAFLPTRGSAMPVLPLEDSFRGTPEGAFGNGPTGVLAEAPEEPCDSFVPAVPTPRVVGPGIETKKNGEDRGPRPSPEKVRRSGRRCRRDPSRPGRRSASPSRPPSPEPRAPSASSASGCPRRSGRCSPGSASPPSPRAA